MENNIQNSKIYCKTEEKGILQCFVLMKPFLMQVNFTSVTFVY